MARADMPDYYAILGVDKSATDVDVKRAYRQLSRTAHPDAGGNPALFQMITLAYNTLKDSGARGEYDAALANPTTPSGYAEEDIKDALAAQERQLRAQWEAETLRWATEQSAAAPSAPPRQAPPTQQRLEYAEDGTVLLDPEEERQYRRLRGVGYVLTASLFLTAYLLRSFGTLSFLDPGAGLVHTTTEFFARGIEPILVMGALTLGAALEHFLLPSLRVIVTVKPWARRLSGAALFWLVLLGEYLAFRPGQILAVLGVTLFMSTLLLPEPVRYRMFELRQKVLRSRSPFHHP